MEIKHILELIDKVEQSSLSSFSMTEKEFSLKMEKGCDFVCTAAPTAAAASAPVLEVTPEEKTAPELKGNIVTAPIVGTFYQASSPEQEPFVKEGQTVNAGDVVCIIEAMKLFNEVQSDYAGTVKKILVKDGDLLEFGQPIMIIE